MSEVKLNRLTEKMLRDYDEHCKGIALYSGEGLDSNESPASRRITRKEKEKDYLLKVYFRRIFQDDNNRCNTDNLF